MAIDRRPRCTPPGAPRLPNIPVCRPGGFITPFGGPASGLSPSGSVPGPSVTPSPTPSPAPSPTCTTADLFAECFTGCNVLGSCGWTVITPAGTVVFDGVKMLEGSSGANAQGEARKALPSAPAGAWTATFEFTEVAAPPSGGKDYALGMFDGAGNGIFSVVFIGDGSLFIGDATDILIGTWTPAAGATHLVRLTGNGAGTLTLEVDGVSIPLTPVAPGPITGTPSVVDASIVNNDLDGQGSFDNIFLTNGIVPASTVFCCP